MGWKKPGATTGPVSAHVPTDGVVELGAGARHGARDHLVRADGSEGPRSTLSFIEPVVGVRVLRSRGCRARRSTARGRPRPEATGDEDLAVAEERGRGELASLLQRTGRGERGGRGVVELGARRGSHVGPRTHPRPRGPCRNRGSVAVNRSPPGRHRAGWCPRVGADTEAAHRDALRALWRVVRHADTRRPAKTGVRCRRELAPLLRRCNCSRAPRSLRRGSRCPRRNRPGATPETVTPLTLRAADPRLVTV